MGSQHGGDPSDSPGTPRDDHTKAKVPFLHSTGREYKWKKDFNIENVRKNLDEMVLVGIGMESAEIFVLDDDANPQTPPMEGLVGIPSRDPQHRHWIGRRGEGAFRDNDWRFSEDSKGEIKSKGQVVIWHPVEMLAALKTLRHCAPISWEQVRTMGSTRGEGRRLEDFIDPRKGSAYPNAAAARSAFDRHVPVSQRHATIRSATASLVVRGLDPECMRDKYLACFKPEEIEQRSLDFDRMVEGARPEGGERRVGEADPAEDGGASVR